MITQSCRVRILEFGSSPYTRLLTLTAKPCSFLTNPLPMLLCCQMLWRLLKWINLMAESNAILKFLNQTPICTSKDNHRRWQHPLDSRKACRLFLKNMGSMFHIWRQSVHQYAHLKAKIVAWPGFSLSREILQIRNQCWRYLSRVLAISAFSCQSFTASWIPLKW